MSSLVHEPHSTLLPCEPECKSQLGVWWGDLKNLELYLSVLQWSSSSSSKSPSFTLQGGTMLHDSRSALMPCERERKSQLEANE